jgi:hypothetical protein
MHELSDEARSILDLAEDAHDPTDRDRRRVRRAMVAQLGATAVISSSSTMAAASGAGATATATGVSFGAKVLASIAIVGMAAGGAALPTTRPIAHPNSEPPPIAAKAPAERAEPARAAPGDDVAPVPAEPPAAEPPPPAPRAHASPTRGDALAVEVGVLGSARAALRLGEPARALALLESHRGTFARGMLREEFLAARVMALHDLGRRSEAAAALAQFAAEMPKSPLLAELASRIDSNGAP